MYYDPEIKIKNSKNLVMTVERVDMPVGFKNIGKYVQKMDTRDFRLKKIGNLCEIKTIPTAEGMVIQNKIILNQSTCIILSTRQDEF